METVDRYGSAPFLPIDTFYKDLDKGAYRDSGYFYGPTQPRTCFMGAKM